MDREERRKLASERLKKNYDVKDAGSGGKSILDFSKIGGYKKELFYHPADGDNLIDIIPYVVSTDHHPQKMKKGYPDYLLDVWVHRFVGPGKNSFLCLQKTFGKPCPICEERDALRKNPDTDEQEVKSLDPKHRCYYNVINLKVPESKRTIQIFEESHFLFEKELLEESANGKDGMVPFFDIEDGASISFRTRSKSSKYGTHFEYRRIDFTEREAYGEDIYDAAFKLDDMLHVPTYEEVRNAFYGVGEEEAVEEAEEVEEKPEPRKVVRAVPAREEVEEEDEEPVKPVATRRTRKVEEAPKSNPCPFDYEFGTDNDEHKECSKCPTETWGQCADKRDLMDKK